MSRYLQLIPTSSNVDYLYRHCYRAIQSANKTIYYSAITEQTSSIPVSVGEEKFISGHLTTFLLVKTYGGVPIVDYNISEAVMDFDRNSAEEVYAFIIKDLQESLSAVGTGTYATTGKVNKEPYRIYWQKCI